MSRSQIRKAVVEGKKLKMPCLKLLRKAPVAVALLISCTPVVSRAQTSGSLSGQVQTEDGKPVEGALISAHAKVSKADGAASAISGKTGADGTFLLSGLAPGLYQICARDRKAGLLDPCRWSASPPTVTITATDGAKLPTITLKKGRLLEVHIVDDAGVMVADGAKPKLLVGMWQANGLFVTIPVRSQDKKGRVHAQYVPQDKPLQISVTSSEYTIKDSAGVAIDAKSGHPNRAEIQPGDQPITLTFQVTGQTK
jgi:Carboxypeptidase regulatory-like domain